ncbi:uncharacterized protein OCT59_002415 [Rhizophagus irregularis]|uniref:Uncharacterized protein n=1 Tax=Rhizophagus irregularis (strain DAOM 181602 / DAOM 197198 / MUCL 43194) TaxID=747089 RepID=U9SMH3_RHIID|nr:hypothetical protein GLOIN_2v1487499 [Rhizophagus irregularis DAOM 181602=DAOM 197198]POG59835.1 hypothetical protein GLOIN_2v1487499 [Rhizophagus irregularis DAOM 181602=DAOM 197198]UZO10837.1 hypothetical protein OCT59_002415 [Rhizophagus irregularis]GBC18105.1 hypothetical protein GLOIN_2v1487499 [Rhizophagus irregularis DAOM 181602=DAOM 197198]CAG8727521.1 14049_t:CDS:2 [Rhizophagus irregularis]|eukprot:XP_025166701.1 hypothetical protein GLOIN_2v1487499 [Rhizophagus irregularis DAOM 181602=DAOM 197198]
MLRYARTLRSLNTLRNNPARSTNTTTRKLSTSDASNTASTSSTNNLDNKNSSFGRNVVNIAAIVGLAGGSFITIYKINKLGDEIGVIKEDIGLIKGYLFAGSGERLKTEQTATANIDQTEAKEPWFKFFNL